MSAIPALTADEPRCSSEPEVAPARLLRRIDHVLVRVEPERFDPLLQLLEERLGIPACWRVSRGSEFTWGGVSLVSVGLKLARLGPARPAAPPQALYGLGFAPGVPIGALPTVLRDVGARCSDVAPYAVPDPSGVPRTLWRTVFLQGLTGERNGWLRVLSAGTRLMPDPPPRPTSPTAGAPWDVFNSAFEHGMYYAVEYAPPFQGPLQSCVAATLSCRPPLGALGILGVEEIRIGAADLPRAVAAWARALAPAGRDAQGRFVLTGGPPIRLIKTPRPGPNGIVLRVASRAEARRVLQRERLLSSEGLGGLEIGGPAAGLGLVVQGAD